MVKFDNLGKIYINGVLKLGVDKIEYNKIIYNKGEKYEDNDVLKYLIDKFNKEISKSIISENIILKLVTAIDQVLYYSNEIEDDMRKKCSEVVSNYIEFSEKNDIHNNLIDKKIKELTDSITCTVVDALDINTKIEDTVEPKKEEIKVEKENNAEIKKIQKELLSKQNKLEKNIALLENSKKELKDSKETIKQLQKENKVLSKKIEDTEKSKNGLQTLYNIVEEASVNDARTIENQKNEISDLNLKISEYKKTIEQYDNIFNKNEDKEKIFDYICDKELSVNDIVSYIMYNYNKTEYDALKIFKELVKEKNLVSDKTSISGPIYKVGNPLLGNSLTYSIDTNNAKSIDILFVSDLHLSDYDQSIITDLDCMYNYASSNGINLIMNLGDVFDFRDVNSSNFRDSENLLNQYKIDFPGRNGVTQYFLGGNHDKELAKYGIDPIKELCNDRDDFVYLGYDKKILSFSNKDYIGLFHPYSYPREKMEEDNYYIESISRCIKKMYSDDMLLSRKSYIDILGHLHKSMFITNEGFITLPSYNFDRYMDGALHAKVYFNDDNTIKEIVFMPLIFDGILRKTSELCYKKQI